MDLSKEHTQKQSFNYSFGARPKRAHRVRLGVGDDTLLTHGGHFLELT
jgi:hypothetical protein